MSAHDLGGLPLALLVFEPTSGFAPSVDFLKAQLGAAGVAVRSTSPSDLRAQLREALEGGLATNGLLLISEDTLGPIGDPAPFLEWLVGPRSFALAPADRGSDPISVTSTLLYLGTALCEAAPFRRWLSEERGPLSLTRLQAYLELEASDLRYAYALVDTSENPGDYLLRDALLQLTWGGAELSGAPFVPWSVFTHDPLALERWGVPTQSHADALLELGYPEDVFWNTLLQVAAPETWFVTTGQLRVLTSSEQSSPNLRFGVALLPANPQDLAVLISAVSSLRDVADIRLILPSVAGSDDRAQDAVVSKAELLFSETAPELPAPKVSVACPPLVQNGAAALLEDWNPDVTHVLVLSGPGSAEIGERETSTWRQVTTNLIGPPGYQRAVRQTLDRNHRLGLVFSPLPAPNTPQLDRLSPLAEGLVSRFAAAAEQSAPTTVAPVSGCYWARVSALGAVRTLFEELAEDELAGLTQRDVDQLVAYGVYSTGHFGRSVQTIPSAEHQSLISMFRLDNLSRYSHPYPLQAVETLRNRPSRKPLASWGRRLGSFRLSSE